MRFHCLTAIALLASCAQPSPPAAQPVAGSAPQPDQPAICGGRLLNTHIRDGEDAPFVVTVKSNSQWCFDGISRSGNSVAGERVVTPPLHGQVRLVPDQAAMIFGYRPAPGFVGTDHFRIAVPAEIESVYLAVSVTVTP